LLNRVHLQTPIDDCDYINANWIRGYLNEHKFIATQGPILETIPHFWQMVVENDVKVIVMLTKLVEQTAPSGICLHTKLCWLFYLT